MIQRKPRWRRIREAPYLIYCHYRLLRRHGLQSVWVSAKTAVRFVWMGIAA